MGASLIFCVNCGGDVSGQSFCPSCGKSVQTQQPISVSVPDGPTIPPVTDDGHLFRNKRRSTPALVYVLSGAVGLVALIILFVTISSGPTALEAAYESCESGTAFGISLDDDGKGMFLDMQGEEDAIGADYTEIMCILGELEVPSSVLSQISNTNSLMGTQTASWENITASWTYHPDRGLDMKLTVD